MSSVRAAELWLTSLCVVGITAGQILFRLAAQRLDGQRLLMSAIQNPWLWIALAIYGVATLLWIHVLRTAPLHRVYPLFAMAFVCVPLVEHWIWNQPMRWQSWVGGLLIVAGVAVSVGAFERTSAAP